MGQSLGHVELHRIVVGDSDGTIENRIWVVADVGGAQSSVARTIAGYQSIVGLVDINLRSGKSSQIRGRTRCWIVNVVAPHIEPVGVVLFVFTALESRVLGRGE